MIKTKGKSQKENYLGHKFWNTYTELNCEHSSFGHPACNGGFLELLLAAESDINKTFYINAVSERTTLL